MVGIRYYGGYIPFYRLERKKIFQSIGWANGALAGYARGEKAVAGFDEDSLTMAVAACHNCARGVDRRELGGVYFASTTMPFKERLCAGVIAGTMAMNDEVRSADFSSSLKSGTTALISAFEAVQSMAANNIMVCASDCRLGKAGSPQEMIFGDAAAAFMVSDQDVIAEYKGAFSMTRDFVDHYRGAFERFDRQWEDRWIRDKGFDTLIPAAINGVLKKFNLNVDQIANLIYPCYYPAERKKLNATIGIPPERVEDDLFDRIGEMGSAQPLVMLISALEKAKPGDKLIVISAGNGCDALYFEVTDQILHLRERKGVSWYLTHKAQLDKYEKYLAWRDILPVDVGLRGEEDFWTRWSLIERNRKAILGFCGSQCKTCGTPQFPAQRICVNPKCGAVDQMEDYYFFDKPAKIFSYTGDNLAASINPPSIYGSVLFDEGGRFMMNFTDCDLDSVSVGMPVSFSFRIKYLDKQRDIVRYFWKAVPLKGEDN